MMDGYPVHRTPEQGHVAACLAKAIIAAVENVRDAFIAAHPDPEASRVGFRLAAQANDFLTIADGYLADGMTECICPVTG